MKAKQADELEELGIVTVYPLLERVIFDLKFAHAAA
jgi:hypothetical protein